MGSEKKKRVDSGHVLGFVAVVLTALYTFRLSSHLDGIRDELLGFFALRIIMPHFVCVVLALAFSLFGFIVQKRWCMIAACISIGISALFMLEYVRYVALPAIFLFFAYVEMD